MFLDSEAHALTKYFLNLGQVQKALIEHGNKILHIPQGAGSQNPCQPGDWVLLKTWEEKSPPTQNN